MQHEQLQRIKEEAASSVCKSIVEVSVVGEVPRDLEAIFRRGPEWDQGLDHVLFVQVGHQHLVGHCKTH